MPPSTHKTEIVQKQETYGSFRLESDVLSPSRPTGSDYDGIVNNESGDQEQAYFSLAADGPDLTSDSQNEQQR